MIVTTYYDAPVGRLLLAARDEALVGLWIQDQKYYLGSLRQEEQRRDDACPVLLQAANWLDRYFAGERPAIRELRLAPAGSLFRQQVWDILCRIPYGQVTTYGEIARAVAAQRGLPSMSAQAVGGAVGHNPISILIPCHRVVGTDGSLTGYAGGLDRKRWLLDLEGADLTGIYRPSRENG